MGETKNIKVCALQMNSETGNVRANYKKVQDIVSKELPADADF